MLWKHLEEFEPESDMMVLWIKIGYESLFANGNLNYVVVYITLNVGNKIKIFLNATQFMKVLSYKITIIVTEAVKWNAALNAFTEYEILNKKCQEWTKREQ